jgi:hypothetical protein
MHREAELDIRRNFLESGMVDVMINIGPNFL